VTLGFDQMKVRIVCYEDVDSWILGKFARRLCEHLRPQGVEVDISKSPDEGADINHHIIYVDYDGASNGTDTVMVTHIDTDWKVEKLKQQMVNAAMAICMSTDTMRLLAKTGVPRAKLCTIHPAHDGAMQPRKITVGITSKVQPSGCKREKMIAQLADRIPPADFRFQIMGPGWEEIVATIRSRGIEVDYVDHFDGDLYRGLMLHLDYYLYAGWDEGSMGFLDALAAGVRTIVTPQGFHLDATGGITHPFRDIDDLERIFVGITQHRRRLVNSVSGWTWPEYAKQHLRVWEYLLRTKESMPISSAMRRELRCLGVARSRSLASLQTTFYRATCAFRRGAARIGRYVAARA
jgi:hypothetical protein